MARCADVATQPLVLEALGAGLWRVPGQAGDASPANRGQVVNLLAARHRGRWWLLGTGPSPAFARALQCHWRERFGQPVAAAIVPYARAELVLGNAGLAGVPIWAAPAVGAAMRRQCPRCVQRLREQLGDAAADLGAEPVRLPDRALSGRTGRLGPFDWQLLMRGAAAPVTVWRHRGAAITAVFGLAWFDGPPDGGDADPRRLAAALRALADGAAPGERFVGDQGPVSSVASVRQQQRYWQALLEAAEQQLSGGGSAAELSRRLPSAAGNGEAGGMPAQWTDHPRHRLNWQRVLRQVEDESLGPPR